MEVTTAQKRKEIERLKKLGLSLNEIANITNLSPATVLRQLKKAAEEKTTEKSQKS